MGAEVRHVRIKAYQLKINPSQPGVSRTDAPQPPPSPPTLPGSNELCPRGTLPHPMTIEYLTQGGAQQELSIKLAN